VAGGGWPEYIASLRRIYRDRRDVMLDALTREMPEGTTWTKPEGGLFVWATLPEYIDTTDLLARALRENFAFVPGRAAWVDGSGGSSMRLNFSGASEDEIREGIRRLGVIVGEQVELFATMTGKQPPKSKPVAQEGGRVVPFAPLDQQLGQGGAA
jgi:2-aminoadipate transaminase